MTTNKNKVQEILEHSHSAKDFAGRYLTYVGQLLSQISSEEIAAFISTLERARESGATVFFIGNGGSAATASHFVNDLTFGTRSWKKPFKTLCLSDNLPGLTAIANDYGYEDVFVLPLKAYFKPGDILVAISASGNSPNLIKAIDFANANDMVTIGLTGFDGGKLKEKARLSVHVPTAKGEYGPVEDAHMVLDHLVGAYLSHQVLKEEQMSK